MSEQIPESSIPSVQPIIPAAGPAAPISFWQTWVMAVTKPSQQTYAAIASSPSANSVVANLWIMAGSLVNAMCLALVQVQRNGQGTSAAAETLGGALGRGLMAVAGFWLEVWLLNQLARLFGGRAPMERMAYTIAAILLPINVISAALNLATTIPYVGFCFYVLELILLLYLAIAIAIAVKAVHQISWGGAVAAAVGAPGIIFVGVVALLMMFGPMMGNLLRSMGMLSTP